MTTATFTIETDHLDGVRTGDPDRQRRRTVDRMTTPDTGKLETFGMIAAIVKTTNAALDVWDDVDPVIAVDVLRSVIDILTDELVAFETVQNRERDHIIDHGTSTGSCRNGTCDHISAFTKRTETRQEILCK